MGEKRDVKVMGGAASAVMSLAAVVLYCTTSMSMTFLNKGAMLEYDHPNAILMLQMLSTMAIVAPLKALNIVSFPPVNLAKCKQLLPLTILYTANVACALVGLAKTTVPMYNALKRLTPVFILVSKACLTGVSPPLQVSGSVLLIVSGCIVAALGDFAFDTKGYAFALLSCSLQTAYLLIVEKTGAKKDATSTELLFYNAFLSLPFVVLLMMLTGEWSSAVPDFLAGCSRLGSMKFSALVLSCACMGTLLNFALFWCTHLNSALTTTIAGVMKGVIQTIIGFFVFGGVRFSHLNVTGITMNSIGGVWYTYIKYYEKAGRTTEQKSEKKHSEGDLEGAARR